MSTTRTCSVRGLEIRLDLDSEEESAGVRNYELWRAGHYDDKEPDTLDWIDTRFEEGDVIYDIGANIGQYSFYAAKRLNSNVKIFAFEPEALSFAKLNRNIVLNELTGVIVAYPIAVSDRSRLDTFYVKTFVPGASLHALGREITQGEVAFEPQNRQGTFAASIDDLVDRFGLPAPTHIKVDVDGIEDRIVEGARATFERPELRTVLIEVFMHGDIAERIRRDFESGGFELSDESQVDFTTGVVQNLIFVR